MSELVTPRSGGGPLEERDSLQRNANRAYSLSVGALAVAGVTAIMAAEHHQPTVAWVAGIVGAVVGLRAAYKGLQADVAALDLEGQQSDFIEIMDGAFPRGLASSADLE